MKQQIRISTTDKMKRFVELGSPRVDTDHLSELIEKHPNCEDFAVILTAADLEGKLPEEMSASDTDLWWTARRGWADRIVRGMRNENGHRLFRAANVEGEYFWRATASGLGKDVLMTNLFGAVGNALNAVLSLEEFHDQDPYKLADEFHQEFYKAIDGARNKLKKAA